jgi:hypothetical protein
MKKLVYKGHSRLDRWHKEAYSSDIDSIVLVAYKNGYDIDREDAQLVWEEHSEDYAAGWLMLEPEEDILFYLKKYCNEVEVFDLHQGNHD